MITFKCMKTLIAQRDVTTEVEFLSDQVQQEIPPTCWRQLWSVVLWEGQKRVVL